MGNATNRWLDKLAAADKAKGGTGSDYALAKVLGVERQMVSKYRRGVSQMGDDAAIAAAEALGIRPIIVIAEVASEVARSERAKKFWIKAATKAAILAASVSTIQGVSPSQIGKEGGATMYIMLNRRRPKRAPIPSHTPGRVVPLTGALRASA